MKKNLVIGILIAVAIFLIFYSPGVYNKSELNAAIDSLDTEIELKRDSIDVLETEIQVIDNKLDSAEAKLEENKGKIKTIYKEYEVQIQTVDSYDVNQLEQFFSDRYKDSSSTK